MTTVRTAPIRRNVLGACAFVALLATAGAAAPLAIAAPATSVKPATVQAVGWSASGRTAAAVPLVLENAGRPSRAEACALAFAEGSLHLGRGGRFRLRLLVDNESGRYDGLDARKGLALVLEREGRRVSLTVGGDAAGWTPAGGRVARRAHGAESDGGAVRRLRLRDRSLRLGHVVVATRGRLDRSFAPAGGARVGATVVVDSLCAAAATPVVMRARRRAAEHSLHP